MKVQPKTHRRTWASAMLMAALLPVLGGCGETTQTAGDVPKADGRPWQTGSSAFQAPGFKAGDQAGWEQQINQRAQSQNDYARAPAKAQ